MTDQPDQMQLNFEGATVAASWSKLKSCTAMGLSKLAIGTKVRLEIEAEVVGVDHKTDKDLGLVRIHALKALDDGAHVVEEI
jgi:hypothetical protein